MEGERRRTVCGTPNYIAPEVLEGKEGHSYEVDIWSFGVILYTMLIGRPPFETQEIKQTYKRIKAINYQFPENVQVSKEAKDLIKRILVLDPYERPSIEECLDHPFFNTGNEIPSLLPPSTLACPPSQAYMRQFQVDMQRSGQPNKRRILSGGEKGT